jgi:hypothetical protein
MDAASSPDLWLSRDTVARFASAIDVIDPGCDGAVTSCFGASYGKVWTRAGSYLGCADASVRRFAPREVASMLGFSADFAIPVDLPMRRLWHLLGNSLSIPAVEFLLKACLQSE